MGQPIVVTSRPGVRADVVIFEINRSLTGMRFEHYAGTDAVTGNRPPDELARRLFELGVTSLTVYSSAVVVEAPAERGAELREPAEEIVRQLYVHYRDGVVPEEPELVEAPAETPAEGAAST